MDVAAQIEQLEQKAVALKNSVSRVAYLHKLGDINVDQYLSVYRKNTLRLLRNMKK